MRKVCSQPVWITTADTRNGLSVYDVSKFKDEVIQTYLLTDSCSCPQPKHPGGEDVIKEEAGRASITI